MTNHCPHCGVSLVGEPIPERSREFYGAATHFRREIGVEVAGIYDGVLFWKCPDCDGAWHRFVSGWQRDRAERFVNPPKREVV